MTAHSDRTIRILVVDDHQVVRQDQEPDQPALIEGGWIGGEGGRLGGGA